MFAVIGEDRTLADILAGGRQACKEKWWDMGTVCVQEKIIKAEGSSEGQNLFTVCKLHAVFPASIAGQ